ncbi:MAG: DUF4339 domain-containing protein [Akkermansia sp.]|nr:DUF4339 domain-containing protein [Akkermansia sp.]
MNNTYHLTQPGGTPHGPYSLEAIKDMMAKGQINSQTLCYTEGMQNWAPISTIIPGHVIPPPPSAPVANDIKPRAAYVILGIFLGYLGIHNFYAGYVNKGVAQLLITLLSCTVFTPIVFIWNIIEVCTVNKDAKGIPFS